MMDKWICIKDSSKDNLMINLSLVKTIYCEDALGYARCAICFYEKGNPVHISYDSKKNRDCHFEQIQIFLNRDNCFFLQIESDIP